MSVFCFLDPKFLRRGMARFVSGVDADWRLLQDWAGLRGAPFRSLVKIDHHPAQWGTDTLRTQQSLDFRLRGIDFTVAGRPLWSS